ncbi:hypothetical protein F5Y16DRAFT_37665 [Xylariaceae sp. FL0255]|nr:hypothetical protein F5Y16DRAFT_37665 [Xylariaceae sp. FL0255]
MTTVYTPELQTTTGIDEVVPGTPLLTIFTPPDGCDSDWFYDPSTTGIVWSDSGHNYGWGGCQPSNIADVYSPGICPSGQELKVVTKILGQTVTTAPLTTVYAGVCCSSSFTWSTEIIIPLDSTLLEYDVCVASFTPPCTAFVATSNARPVQTVIDSEVVALGNFISIEWEETDLSSFPASLAASLRAGMGLSAYSTSSTSTAKASSSSALPSVTISSEAGVHVHLSQGAIAGISIGAATVFLVIVILGYLAFARRWGRPGAENQQDSRVSVLSSGKQNRSNRSGWIAKWQKNVEAEANTPPIPEMEQGDNIYKHFSGGAWRSELGGNQTHLHSPGNVSELDSGMSSHSASTAKGPVMELEGSASVRQEPIPEVCED